MTLFCLSRLFLEHLAQVVEKGSCRPPAGSGTGPRRRKAGLQAGRPPSTAQHGASIALTAAGAARPPSTAQDGSSMAAAPAGTTPAGPQPRPAPPLGTRPAQRPPARQPRPRPLPAARTRSCAAVEKAREGAFRAAHTHPPPPVSLLPPLSPRLFPLTHRPPRPAVPHSGRCRESAESGHRATHKSPWYLLCASRESPRTQLAPVRVKLARDSGPAHPGAERCGKAATSLGDPVLGSLWGAASVLAASVLPALEVAVTAASLERAAAVKVQRVQVPAAGLTD